ncbi:MAG: hypothetical protein WD225_13000 [Ilumatobacteraceae bacterium]
MLMPTAAPPPARRGRALVIVGVAMVVIGLVGAVALSLVARSRVDATVRDLARAPIGCDTTLEFSDTGAFVVFAETTGRIDELSGGCDVPDRYDRRSEDLPRVNVEMVGPDGSEVSVDDTDADEYDAAGFRGRPLGEVRIDAAGRHVVRVTSPDSGFAVAIGRDPATVGEPFTIAAVLVAALGVLGGGTMVAVGVVRGRRRPPDEPASSAPQDEWRRPATPVAPPAAPPPPPPPPGAVAESPEPPPPGQPLPPPSGPPVR